MKGVWGKVGRWPIGQVKPAASTGPPKLRLFLSHGHFLSRDMIQILPYNQSLHVVIMLIQLVLACSKALLPTKSNPASIKERAEVFPPGWRVEALQTPGFCYSASVGIGIIVLQIILLE